MQTQQLGENTTFSKASPLGANTVCPLMANASVGALAWDFADVRTFLHDREGVSIDDLNDMEREYGRYMKLVAENRNVKLPVSPPVDQFWHAHILFSRDYTNFSQKMMGTYIHHYPALTQEERIRLAPDYELTRRLYCEKFEVPDEKWWPSDCICSSCTGPGGSV